MSKSKIEKEVLLAFINVQRGTVKALISKLKHDEPIDLEPLANSLDLLKEYVEHPESPPAHII